MKYLVNIEYQLTATVEGEGLEQDPTFYTCLNPE